MKVDWQLAAVALIVAIAINYLAYAAWRVWRGDKSGCGGGCHCDKKAFGREKLGEPIALISSEELSSRLRRSS